MISIDGNGGGIFFGIHDVTINFANQDEGVATDPTIHFYGMNTIYASIYVKMV